MLALLDARPPTLGAGRLLCVDGPAGSGKTTLAAAVARARPASRVVAMDDLYDGWDGLAGVESQVEALLGPLARGEPGSYRRYDWHAARFAETVPVPVVPLLVLEGVGSGAAEHADLITLLVWIEADAELRFTRGLARDGEHLRPEWERWMLAEMQHFATHRTRDRADLILHGAGPSPAP